MLRKAYLSVFEAAAAGCRVEHLAVPAIGCGVQGWRPAVSAHEAAHALEQAARERMVDPDSKLVVPSTVDLVMYNTSTWKTWRLVIEKVLGAPQEESREHNEARWELPLHSS